MTTKKKRKEEIQLIENRIIRIKRAKIPYSRLINEALWKVDANFQCEYSEEMDDLNELVLQLVDALERIGRRLVVQSKKLK